MKEDKKILAIIPARGGSKGILRKNITTLAGKPLIAYSIEVAKKSRYINRVVVSTDDNEIARIARIYESEIIMRPKELAKDSSSVMDAVFHVLDTLEKEENYIPDIVILLQPTSPLRSVDDVDNAIELFLNSNGCESVVGVCENTHLYWSFKIERGYLKPIFRQYIGMRRQKLPKLYLPNGAIFISTPHILKRYKSFYCNKTIPYVMPPERSIDIDEKKDLIIAELLMKEMEYEEDKNRE